MSTSTFVNFPVSEVERASTPLPEVPYKEAVEALLGPRFSDRDRAAIERYPEHFGHLLPKERAHPAVEACTRYHGRLVGEVAFHPLVAAADRAYDDHRPLCLSPDAIWLAICQGVSNHVNAHARRLRPLLVRHEGKLTLVVRRDDFVKGAPENPWAEVFAGFSGQIREHVGPKIDLFLPDFSTTGPADRAAAEVVLLEAMKSYFDYVLKTRCGIPEIRLEGTPEDWQAIADRVEGFAELDLGGWVAALGPILRQFVRASGGDVDRPFWRSLYKLEDPGSGGPMVTGWITAFFPYLKDWQTGRATSPSGWLSEGSGEHLEKILEEPERVPSGYGYYVQRETYRRVGGLRHGPGMASFPGGLSIAPFTWDYFGRAIPMQFLGGFVGVSQDEQTLALRPEIGWAVREAPGAPEPG